MPEVLSAHLGQIQASPVLERLGLEPQGYFLLSAHREENIDTEEAFLSCWAPSIAWQSNTASLSCTPVIPGPRSGWSSIPGSSTPWSGSTRLWAFTITTGCSWTPSAFSPTAVPCRRRAASSAPTAFPSPPSASAPSPSGPKLWSAVPSSCPVSGKSRCSLPWRRPFPWPHKKTWAPRCRTIRMRRSPAKWPPFLQSYATQDIRK